jgi:hypothetical protein
MLRTWTTYLGAAEYNDAMDKLVHGRKGPVTNRHTQLSAIRLSRSLLFCLAVVAYTQAVAGEAQAEFFRLLNFRRCEELSKLVSSAPEADGLFFKAIVHDIGFCAPLDESLADTFYLQSAKAGNADAMFPIWLRTAKRVRSPNPPTTAERTQAVEWLFRAGELQNREAAWMLWQFYENAFAVYGHERDEAEAAHWKQIYELNRPPPARDP